MSKRTVVLVLAAVAVLIVFGVVRAQEREYALDTPALTATEVDGEIVLSWTEVEGATRYDLQVWDCVNEWRPISENDLRTTEAAHTDPQDGITYLYTVQALNDRGERSDWAARSKDEGRYDFVRETANPIPSPEFEIVPQADHIRLAFSEVEQAVGYQARVWHPGAGNRWLWLPEENLDLESRTFSWYGVQPGTDYFFLMRSYSENKCGFSDWSAYQVHTFAGGTTGGGEATSTTTPAETPVPATTGSPGGVTTGGDEDGGDGDGTTGVANTPTPPGTPTATATATATTRPSGIQKVSWAGYTVDNHDPRPEFDTVDITVRWHPLDPPPDQYVLQITVIDNTGALAQNDREVSGNQSQYGPLGVYRKHVYVFHIRGKNIDPVAYGPFSTSLSVLSSRTFPDTPTPTATPIPRPPAPANLTAENTLNGVYLNWDTHPAPFSGNRLNEGGVFEHEISRRLGNGNWQVIDGIGPRTSYTDRTAYAGNTYTYRVRALNKAGWGGYASATHTYVLAHTPTPTPTPVPPTHTPTPTPDPCAGNTCPADACNGPGCSALDRQCGCNCDCFCDALPALAHEFEDHPLLHELMMKRYRTQMPIWSHPYYRLTEFR